MPRIRRLTTRLPESAATPRKRDQTWTGPPNACSRPPGRVMGYLKQMPMRYRQYERPVSSCTKSQRLSFRQTITTPEASMSTSRSDSIPRCIASTGRSSWLANTPQSSRSNFASLAVRRWVNSGAQTMPLLRMPTSTSAMARMQVLPCASQWSRRCSTRASGWGS